MTQHIRTVAVLIVVGTLVLLTQLPAASTVEPEAQPHGDDPRALELIRLSATAGSRYSFTGTQYVTAWSALGKSEASTSGVVQVTHHSGGSTSMTVHGRQTEILDNRDAASWLADGGGPADLLAGAYDVRLGGVAEVAGRTADVVEAYRRDGSVAARLWLDRETTLAVRRETFDSDGSLLSASAYVELFVVAMPCCGSGGDTAVTDDVGADDAMLSNADLDRLRADGWHCAEHLGAGLVLYEARRFGDALHLSYSDGVMNVSVFEQPGRLDADSLEGYSESRFGDGSVYTSAGPPARFTWSTGDRVLTVVADAPLEVVDELLAAMPPETVEPDDDGDGFFDRLGRGAQRVASWLNPFD